MSSLVIDGGSAAHRIQAFRLPDATSSAHVSLAIGTVSASTAALPAGMYRFSTDVDCFIVQGTTATTSHMPFKTTDSGEYFYVNTNGVVSAITAAGTGTLRLTRMP